MAKSNIPSQRVTTFTAKRPELALSEGQRVAVLNFKTDKETKVKPDSQAIILNRITVSTLIHQTTKGSEFLQAIVDAVQDTNARRCVDGLCDFELVENAEKLVADFFDTSRSASGSRVTMEVVGIFYDAHIANWLKGKVIAKYPQFDDAKIAAVLAQYRQSFCDLAKYQLPHTKVVYKMLDKVWTEWFGGTQESVDCADTDMIAWVAERLAKLNDRLNADEMLLEAI